MTIAVETYVLYGTKIKINSFDPELFEDKNDYIDYLHEIINKKESPYKLIYNESDNNYYFGFVIDKAVDSTWEIEYLSSKTFTEIVSTITEEIERTIDMMLFDHFKLIRKNCKIEHQILTVY